MSYKIEYPFTYYIRKEYFLVKPLVAMYDEAVFEDKADALRYANHTHGNVETILVHPKGTLTWKS